MAAYHRLDHSSPVALHNGEHADQFASSPVAGWQQLKWHQEQAREWESHLKSLQQCIGELLTPNQRLRSPLPPTTNHR